MKLPAMPFTVVNWTELPASEHAGATGTSHWRSFESAGLRIRIVDYAPGYVADHWCDRGHVLYVISGEIEIRLHDGTSYSLGVGSGFVVSDEGDAAHLVVSETGCRAFIVD